jgi:hypothetical protein
MLKRRWRRSSSPAVWSVLLTLGIPALVQAQTQLFPLAPIQRQRVPCPMEDPVYGLYRQQYWGYFPTCWRAFPPGWGCPSPYVADFEQSKREYPLARPEPLQPLNMEPDMEPGAGEAPAGPRGRAPNPPLPRERSPFELDRPGASSATPGGGAMPPQVSRARRPALPAPAARIDPTPAATADEKGSGIEASAPLSVLPDPVEAAPAPVPAPPRTATDSARLEPIGPVPGPPFGPGASAGPQPAMPATSLPPPVLNPNPLPPPAAGDTPVASPLPVPVQAPQRRGPISSLFNGMTSWLRR